MLKILSSTAMALLLATPVWAEGGTESTASEDTTIQTETEGSGDLNAQTGEGATGETVYPEDEDTAEADEELPDVSESQPGVITGEDVQVDEDQPDAGRGTTE